MGALPLFHSFGMTCVMNIGVHLGAAMILVPNPRDLPSVLEAAHKHRPTIFCGVPTMYSAINNFKELKKYLIKLYELTDAQMKFNTLLLEMRSSSYSKRLKIEIRREVKRCDFEERIAFSKYGTRQVILRVHTLEQMMKNKIKAALDRKDIRDFFDMEFLLRQGAPMGASKNELLKLKDIAGNFKGSDYKVTLGSVLEPEARKYYLKNKFAYLLGKIDSILR